MRHLSKWLAFTVLIGDANGAIAQANDELDVRLLPGVTVEHEFTAISAVRELADGRVLLVDEGDGQVFVVDFAQRRTVAIGARGSGPSEYLKPASLLPLAADSTILPDPPNDRWLVLHGSKVVGIQKPAIPDGVSQRVPVGADTLGQLVFLSPIRAGPGGPIIPERRDSRYVVRTSRVSGRLDTIALLRSRTSTISMSAGPRPSISVRVNPLALGEGVVTFSDGWVAVARVEPYRVDWITPAGKLLRGAPLPFVPVRLDQRELRYYAEREADRTGTRPIDPATIPGWPEIMPPFLDRGLTGDSQGRLWVRRPATSASPRGWYDVINRRGLLAGRVFTNDDRRIVGFGPGTVYTARVDENGVEHFERHPLPRVGR